MMVIVRLVCGWAVVGMWLLHGGWWGCWYVCSCQYVVSNSQYVVNQCSSSATEIIQYLKLFNFDIPS